MVMAQVLVLIMGRRLWYRVLRLFVFLRIIKIIENKFEQRSPSWCIGVKIKLTKINFEIFQFVFCRILLQSF